MRGSWPNDHREDGPEGWRIELGWFPLDPRALAYDMRYNATFSTCVSCGAEPCERHLMDPPCRAFVERISDPSLRA